MDSLHLSKIAQREFHGNIQHRAECTGCAFVSMFVSDQKYANDAAEIHALAMKQKREVRNAHAAPPSAGLAAGRVRASRYAGKRRKR